MTVRFDTKRAVFLLGLFATAVGGTRPVNAAAPGAGSVVDFTRDIRPIISDKCFSCHGPDGSRRKGKLRLDDRAWALASAAIVPGKPHQSEIIKRIDTTDPDDLMPPAEAKKPLTKRDKDLLRLWIEQGATYEPHWSFQPVRRPPVPAPSPQASTANPIDAFIVQRLGEAGLSPSPVADRRTLLRRLSLDLVGLPPTPKEVEAFVRDGRADALDRQVNRLLASPHYGERMAIPWLDAVRFADTVGYHGDQNINVFPYRDYVIKAFNENKSFADFTREQLAGDLLPDPTPDQLAATGFNRLNMVTREGGAQPKEYLAKYASDRVRTLGAAWLGLTTGCAECHDHKYDPLSTRDFYSLSAFFSDIRQWGLYGEYDYTPNPDLKGWSNEHPFPPEVLVDSPYQRTRRDHLRGELTTLGARARAAKTSTAVPTRDSWRRYLIEKLRSHPDGFETLVPQKVSTGADEGARVVGDVVVLRDAEKIAGDAASAPDPKREPGQNRKRRADLAPSPGWLTSVKVDLIPRPEHLGRFLRPGSEALVLRNTMQVSLKLKRGTDGPSEDLAVAFANATDKVTRYDNGFVVHGVSSGWVPVAGTQDRTQSAVFQLAQPRELTKGDTVTVVITGGAPGAFRLSVSPVPIFGLEGFAPRVGTAEDPGLPDTIGRARTALLGRDSRGPSTLEDLYLLGPGFSALDRQRFWTLFRELLDCRGGRALTVITMSVTPRPVRVLPRGNWQDDSGPIVNPDTPEFLPRLAPVSTLGGAPTAIKRRTRLDLARWLTSRDNPLTARVFVNRLWRQLMGLPLASPLADLGAQGEPPTHRALLDWLAAEFMDSGWDVKRMVRLMVSSHTYQQSSDLRPNLAELDPGNRLHGRALPRRLEAEMVRDNALFASDLLNLDVGGPSVRPYQPDGHWDILQSPSRPYDAHRDDRQWRRGVYVHWQRTFLHPMLANFDAPSRDECVADRNVSITPQQALTLLNDPTFIEAARVLAERLLRDPGLRSDAHRVDQAFARVLGRPSSLSEREGLLAFLNERRAFFASQPLAAQRLLQVGLSRRSNSAPSFEHAAWAELCRVVLNLNEAVTRY